MMLTLISCSTPEGIETVISARRGGEHTTAIRCSTPEGIETVISRNGHRLDESTRLCSTPEGIETVIRGAPREHAQAAQRVLNARRHRDGDQRRAVVHDAEPQRRVLNARRHRDGDQLKSVGLVLRLERCSTPEGIETVIRRRA